MKYIKSYCYNKHELPFIITQLKESYNYIDKYCLYEYNYTHTGQKKEYELENFIKYIPDNLLDKLYYKKIDLTNYHVDSLNNEDLSHNINENIQRNWFFNDENIILNDNDIIIDVDCDEIIYESSYELLFKELENFNSTLSITMNLFFYKTNYLWTNNICRASSICKYKNIKNNYETIFNLKIYKIRNSQYYTNNIYGCHMSWVMPIKFMIEKCFKGAHSKFKHLANYDILEKAIKEKKYIFDLNRPFNIVELNLNDSRIPEFLQKDNIFDYLD